MAKANQPSQEEEEEEKKKEPFFNPKLIRQNSSQLFQVSSLNRVLRNLASAKEQTTPHSLGTTPTADSVYDKLRMFNDTRKRVAWMGKRRRVDACVWTRAHYPDDWSED